MGFGFILLDFWNTPKHLILLRGTTFLWRTRFDCRLFAVPYFKMFLWPEDIWTNREGGRGRSIRKQTRRATRGWKRWMEDGLNWWCSGSEDLSSRQTGALTVWLTGAGMKEYISISNLGWWTVSTIHISKTSRF